MTDLQSPITHFEIIGLHGDRDIRLHFDKAIKILVGENGSGKTTVINVLINFLNGDWLKLQKFDFDEIRVGFAKKEEIKLNRNELDTEDNLFHKSKVLRDLSLRMSVNSWNQLQQLIKSGAPRSIVQDFLLNEIDTSHLSERMIDEFVFMLREIYRSRGGLNRTSINSKLQEKVERVRTCFPYPILYFPTYRRVEEDLRSLGFIEKKDLAIDEQLIHFGMSDVQSRFDQITSEIKDSSIEWYSIQNGKMLSQLSKGIQKESIDFESLHNLEVFRIVLDRIGENISMQDKEHILQLINSQEIEQDQYLHLAYFLLNLVQVYDRQRNNDNAIKKFANVINKYLTDKEVRYNESKVDIKIFNKLSGKEMLLEKLSSGEKQVVSIFSRLFLEASIQPYAIFFDEPELSLSLEWQKKLLADIVASGNCGFLLAATHSPFIFENELDQYAEALCVKLKGE